MAYIETNGITVRKKKSRLNLKVISVVLTSIIAVVAVVAPSYFAWQNNQTNNKLYDLEYSIHNYQPVIFSTRPSDGWSKLNTLFFPPNNTIAVLYGNATVDLKVITPYDSNLTINVVALNFTYLDQDSPYLDMNNLNVSEHSVSYLGIMTHQYFIPHDVTYSIDENFLVEANIIVKPNMIPSGDTAIGFPLGDLIFEARLSVIRANQTTINQITTLDFIEHVSGMFTPTP